MFLFSIHLIPGICHNQTLFLKTENANFHLGNSGSGVVFSSRCLVLLWFNLEEGNPQWTVGLVWHVSWVPEDSYGTPVSQELWVIVIQISSRRPGFKSRMISVSDFSTMKMAASFDVENVPNLSPNCWLIPLFTPGPLGLLHELVLILLMSSWWSWAWKSF